MRMCKIIVEISLASFFISRLDAIFKHIWCVRNKKGYDVQLSLGFTGEIDRWAEESGFFVSKQTSRRWILSVKMIERVVIAMGGISRETAAKEFHASTIAETISGGLNQAQRGSNQITRWESSFPLLPLLCNGFSLMRGWQNTREPWNPTDA